MINKVILVGRLGKDPEVRTFDSGTKKASFSLATTETHKNKAGEKVEETDWHNLVCWNSLADIATRFLKKGSLIFVEGRIKTRDYEANGQKKYVTEISVDKLQMLDKAGQPKGQPQSHDEIPWQ